MSSNTVGIVNMIVLLQEDSYNVLQVSQHTGLAVGTIITYFKLFKRKKLIVVAEWKRYGKCRNWVAHYTWKHSEDDVDVRKPKPLTQAERQAAYRKRKQDAFRILSNGITGTTARSNSTPKTG